MKKFICVLVGLFSFCFGASAQENQIEWLTDFKQAQAVARETGHPLMLDFSAAWCKPCQEMDKTFWVSPEVVKAAKSFVAVKINFDKEKALASKYSISAIPNVIFTDPLGNMVTSRQGFSSKNVKELNQIFELMPKDFSPVKQAYSALDVKQNDGDALIQVADFYSKSKMLILANDFYKRASKTDKIKSDPAKQEVVVYAMGANYYNSNANAEAVNYLNDYVKKFPSGKSREIALAMLSVSYAELKKFKDAERNLELLKKEFPSSKNIQPVISATENAKKKSDKK
ncbi:MAG: thioredoxin family protein [Pyrinomonadaceae bacterium]|nr:thioredoxin family protein [Pyrinomonadaceae bacterium]